MLVWPRKYTGNQRGSSSATIDSRNRLKSIFSCFYGRCSFDPDANRHTHTHNFFFHMTLPTVEGTWFNHQILRKHLILDENTKPHCYVTCNMDNDMFIQNERPPIKHIHMCIYTLSIGMFQHEYLLLENT